MNVDSFVVSRKIGQILNIYTCLWTCISDSLWFNILLKLCYYLSVFFSVVKGFQAHDRDSHNDILLMSLHGLLSYTMEFVLWD